jgi:hypothetical protein
MVMASKATEYTANIKKPQNTKKSNKMSKNQHYSRIKEKSNNKTKKHVLLYRKRQGKYIKWNSFPPHSWIVAN